MKSMGRLMLDQLSTPIGKLALVADEQGRLRALGWTDKHARMERFLASHGQLVPTRDPAGLTTALEAYFQGDLFALNGLPVYFEGTPFQRQVWMALREIPPGETRSYRDVACRIGNAASVRAVGLANGSNPVGVVVPCHRVVGSDGSLTGYGGGVERKRWLLSHEASVRPTVAGRATQLALY